MLPSDMTLKIRLGTVGYNNKILVLDGKFNLGKNDEVNIAVLAIKSHKTNSLATPAISHKDSNLLKQTAVTHRDSETAVTHKDLEKKPAITHEEEKIANVKK